MSKQHDLSEAELALAYVPQPIDTSAVTLPAELEPLTEFLAKNAHENWALEKKRQGWRYGPVLDAQAKTHPNLVPYDCLDQSTREYDRITAIQTIKVIMERGFRIEPPPC